MNPAMRIGFMIVGMVTVASENLFLTIIGLLFVIFALAGPAENGKQVR